VGPRYSGRGRDGENDSGQRMQADRERHGSDSPRARNNRERQVGVLPSTGRVFTTDPKNLHRCPHAWGVQVQRHCWRRSHPL